MQVLILGGLMWLVHRYVPILHFHSGYEYTVSRVILVVCLILFVATVYQFWRHDTTINPIALEKSSTLITTGVFSWSRNPVYLTDLLLLLAWTVWLGNWLNLIWLPVFVVYITRYQILPEESVLGARFGPDYAAYTSRTNRWI